MQFSLLSLPPTHTDAHMDKSSMFLREAPISSDDTSSQVLQCHTYLLVHIQWFFYTSN